jgi:cell wall-associated NlpC family hydrolase
MNSLDIRARICTEARRWLGTPWRHRARVLGAGVDCAQLLLAVYEGVGLLKPGQIDPGHYHQDWNLHRSEELFAGWVQSVARTVEQPEPGDIALFRYGRCISHGGVVLEDRSEILHAFQPDGIVTITSLSASAHVADRLAGYYTLIEP